MTPWTSATSVYRAALAQGTRAERPPPQESDRSFTHRSGAGILDLDSLVPNQTEILAEFRDAPATLAPLWSDGPSPFEECP